jgi:hypothetical protein
MVVEVPEGAGVYLKCNFDQVDRLDGVHVGESLKIIDRFRKKDPSSSRVPSHAAAKVSRSAPFRSMLFPSQLYSLRGSSC